MTLPDKGDNQLQSELPTRMSEEGQYRGESHRQQEDSEEEGKPRTHPVERLYTREEIEKFGDDNMTRKKCQISDCVLDAFPEHLKTKAKHICATS